MEPCIHIHLLKEALALEGDGSGRAGELAAESPEPRPQVLLVKSGVEVRE